MNFVRRAIHRLRPSTRTASTMVMETSRMSVLHGPLQPLTRPGDREHPTGFFRDGYCWGSDQDHGKHYVGAVVTSKFLDFSRDREVPGGKGNADLAYNQGNDLVSRRPGFVGLTAGCRWCLCVERWKEALIASRTLGEDVVPRVDLAATALDTLKDVDMVDLERFRWQDNEHPGPASSSTQGS